MNDILIQIANKDRPTELALLLESLRHQTITNFDIHILDDGSTTPILNYYFLNYIIMRMRLEGNLVKVIRNEQPSGVSKARQQLIDEGLKDKGYKYFVRIDDDSIVQEDYLEQLMEVINAGYDVASGVVPPFGGPSFVRESKFITPIIGYCELNNKGELIANFDDCGNLYDSKVIVPSPHFRSCALFKREIFENGISYANKLSRNGFREEQWLSWKIITSGYKIGCNTAAVSWHLMTPSGGERDTMNLGAFNQEQFEKYTKELYEEKGDFLTEYYKLCNVVTQPCTPQQLNKSNNLVSIK